MNILAIDTSSDACSAALISGQEHYLEYTVEPRAHTRLILPMVESVLAQGGITLQAVDALAFGRGPGAFTGVRIATGIVQGLALAADKPVVAVSTLAALAQQAYVEQGAEQVLVAVDARMAEVYWGAYTLADGVMQLRGEEYVLAPEAAPLPEVTDAGAWHGTGSGWAAYAALPARFAACVSAFSAQQLPSAAYIAALAVSGYARGEAVSADQAQPVYLRNKVAQTMQERAQNQG